MVTKNTENNANNALNILPESASTAVDNDEKYLSFALVLAITIMDNLVKLIGTDGFVLCLLIQLLSASQPMAF